MIAAYFYSSKHFCVNMEETNHKRVTFDMFKSLASRLIASTCQLKQALIPIDFCGNTWECWMGVTPTLHVTMNYFMAYDLAKEQ